MVYYYYGLKFFFLIFWELKNYYFIANQVGLLLTVLVVEKKKISILKEAYQKACVHFDSPWLINIDDKSISNDSSHCIFIWLDAICI